MPHWDYIYNNRQLIYVPLLDNIFKDSYQMLYVHRSLLDYFMGYFQETIQESWSLTNGDDTSTVEEWYSGMAASIITSKGSSELTQLLTYFGYCKFLIGLIEQRRTPTLRRDSIP